MDSPLYRKTSNSRMKLDRDIRMDYFPQSQRKISNEPTTRHREMRIRRMATEKTTLCRDMGMGSQQNQRRGANIIPKSDVDISMITRQQNRRTSNDDNKASNYINIESQIYQRRIENKNTDSNMILDIKRQISTSNEIITSKRDTDMVSEKELRKLSNENTRYTELTRKCQNEQENRHLNESNIVKQDVYMVSQRELRKISNGNSIQARDLNIGLHNTEKFFLCNNSTMGKDSKNGMYEDSIADRLMKSGSHHQQGVLPPDEDTQEEIFSSTATDFTELKDQLSSEFYTDIHQSSNGDGNEATDFNELHPSGFHSPRRIFPDTHHQEERMTAEKEELETPTPSSGNSDEMRLEQIQKENEKLREEMLDIKRSTRDYRELTEKLVSELVEIRSEIVKNNGNKNDVVKDLSNIIEENDPSEIRRKDENDKIKINKSQSLSIVDNDNVKVILNDDERTEITENITPERPERKNEIFGQLGKIFKSMTTPERIKNKNEIFSQIGDYYKTIKGEMSCQTDRSNTGKEKKNSRQRFHDIFLSQMERVGLGGLELDDLKSCEIDTTTISPIGSKEHIQTVCDITSEKMKKSGRDFQKLQPDIIFNINSLSKKKKKKKI